MLLTEKPCREVKTTEILFEEKLYGQDQKRAAVYHFPVFSFILVVVATGASVGVWLHLFVCAVTHIQAAISYLCLFGCTCYLVYLAILDQISPDTELLSKHQ